MHLRQRRRQPHRHTRRLASRPLTGPTNEPLRTAVGPSDAKPAPPIGSPWSPLDRHSTPIGAAVPLLVGALTHGTGPSRGWNGSNRCTRRTGFSHGRAGLRCSNGVVCRRCGHAFDRLVAHVLAAARAWGRMSCASVKSAPSVQTRARTRARTPRWTFLRSGVRAMVACRNKGRNNNNRDSGSTNHVKGTNNRDSCGSNRKLAVMIRARRDELARHAPAVRQYVAMHDTTTFGAPLAFLLRRESTAGVPMNESYHHSTATTHGRTSRVCRRGYEPPA